MEVRLKLHSRTTGIAVAAAALLAAFAGGRLVLLQFAASVLSSPQYEVSTDRLSAAAAYYPDSAAIQARLAARYVEVGLDEAVSHEELTRLARTQAARAVNLSPWNYEACLLLATAEEMNGDPAAAEAMARRAVTLAPHYPQVRWRLANLLIRNGKVSEALTQIEPAVAADRSLLPEAFNLLWNATGGRAEMLRPVAGNDPERLIELAGFLLERSLPDEAVSTFRQISRQDHLRLPGSGAFLNSLISRGDFQTAWRLWAEVFPEAAGAAPDQFWNGGFESLSPKGLAQFDWNIRESRFADFSLTDKGAHTGRRSLRIDFLGRDTTRLEGEISHLLLLKPGKSYRLEFFVRTSGLETPEGPVITVSSVSDNVTLTRSRPIEAGTQEWKLYSADFTVPANATALSVSLRRLPGFSYDDPTRGTIWLDDFSLREL